MMTEEKYYTETEIALLTLLSDGLKHPIMEVLNLIKKIVNDNEITKPNMAKTIRRLREKLPKGRQIHCVSEGRRKYYILSRKLNS